MLRSSTPGLRAVEAISVTLTLFLLLFATSYAVMTRVEPGSFDVPPMTRVDGLYFTVTVFATVGFGDLSPVRINVRDIRPLMEGRPGAKSPHEAYYCYWNRELQAVRSGQWKLHFPHEYRTLAGAPGAGGKPGPYRQAKIGAELFDLSNDIGEKVNVADKHPEVVKRLEAFAEQARDDLGDSATKRPGKNVRETGRVREEGT